MPFLNRIRRQKTGIKNNILRENFHFVTRVCDTIASHKKCELSVDRMGRKRYNTPRMPHQYGTIFINCGPRGVFSARRRVSAASLKGVLPVKFFQEVKRNGYFSHLSAQEAPALQGARLPQENVHCQRPQGYRPPSCTRPRPSDPLKREQLAYRMLHMKQ